MPTVLRVAELLNSADADYNQQVAKAHQASTVRTLPLALVVVPTIELVKQVSDELAALARGWLGIQLNLFRQHCYAYSQAQRCAYDQHTAVPHTSCSAAL